MTKNSKVLADFIKYCEEHPDERFWQALCNWSGWGSVLVSDDKEIMNDTYYWEGRNR